MPWLRHHNPEIDWKIGEVKMTRCPDECGKKWRIGRQTKQGCKNQKKKKEKEKRRSTIKNDSKNSGRKRE